jgi:hypothetical protein
MGMGAIRINDTVSIPAALQRAINAQITSTILPASSITYNNNFTHGGLMAAVGTYSLSFGAYSSTQQQLQYNKGNYTTTTTANNSALIRASNAAQTIGIITGNTKFSGGGGRGTFTFALPSYNSGQRIFFGYGTTTSANITDPSTFLNNVPTLGVGKDAADSTLHFMYSSTVGGLQKVNTGIVPNSENVYRVTVYISPNSGYYIQIESISKNRTTTRVLNPTSNVPATGIKLVPYHYINNAATGVAITFGLIQTMEEIY